MHRTVGGSAHTGVVPPRRRADPARAASRPRRDDHGERGAPDGGARRGLGGVVARHRVATTVLVALLVLLVGAAIALPVVDSAARERVADRVAAQAQAELGLRSPPLVRIGGTWFLWQAVRGRYDGATIRTAKVTYDGADLGATRVRLTDVRVPPSVALGGSGTVTVAGGDVRTLAPWALLEQRASAAAGSDVALRRDGDQMAASVDVSGIPLEVRLRPRVTAKAIVLRPTAVSIAGRELGVQGASDLADRFGLGGAADALLSGFSYDLDQTSDQLDVRTATVVRDGLQVGGALRPLSFPVGG